MPLVSELLERFEASDGAKTRFLNYCFDVRDTLQRRDLQDRFKAGQKERIEALLQATQVLLKSPSSVFGTEQDFCGMQKELLEVLTPIMLEVCPPADAAEVAEAATPEAPSHDAGASGAVPEAPSRDATPAFSGGAD